MNAYQHTWRPTTLALTALLAVSLVACGDDEEIAPTADIGRNDTGEGDAGTDGGNDADPGDTGTVDTGDDDAEEPDADSDTTIEDTSGDIYDLDTTPDGSGESDVVEDVEPDVPVSCDGPDGCFDSAVCEPDETLEFLNQCTSSDCEPFDNEDRLPLYADPLPPLP